jgi:hypothetical protein
MRLRPRLCIRRSAAGLALALALVPLLSACGADMSSISAAIGLTPEPTASPAPTATRVPPTATPLPADVNGMHWDLVGLQGQSLLRVTGGASADAPIYAGGDGLYESTDRGQTWTALPLPGGAAVQDIQVSAADRRVIYAGSGTPCAGGPAGAQFRSADAGATWARLPQAPASLQIDARDPNILYGMTCHGVVRSTDAGQSWQGLADPDLAQDPTLTGARVRVPANPIGPIYATWLRADGSGRIRRTYDGGKNWGGSDAFFPMLTDLLVDDKRPQGAWALSQGGVVRTSDGGDTWKMTVTGLDAAHRIKDGEMGPYQLGALAGQYTTSGDLDELYVGTYATPERPAAGAFSSGDLGKVWGRFGGNLGGRDMRGIYVAREKAATGPDRVYLYAATDHGVFKIALGTAR